MPARNLLQLTNIAIRGATLASKFLLIFFLARFLEPSELGLYGLVTATVGYSLYLLGFDFYTYTTREILKLERHEWGSLLKSQGALSLVLYVVFLPLLSLVFVKGLLPWSVAGWFFILLVLEHLTQELGRLLIAISEQLVASLVLFLRSGIWAVALTALMFIEPDSRNLDFVLGAWALGSSMALLLGAFRISTLRISGWSAKVDWSWIAKGLKIAVPFLVATLAIRGVFTFDRYWLEALTSLDVLGAYVLFMGLGAALLSFLDAGVFAFIYPGLIGAYQRQDAKGFRQGVRNLVFQTVGLSLIFTIVAELLIGMLLQWLNKPFYLSQLELFHWILAANFLSALSMIPHYALYAQGRDKPIIYSHVGSLGVFVISVWALSKYWAELAVPVGLCFTFFFILCWKTWSYYLVTPAQFRSFLANSAPDRI